MIGLIQHHLALSQVLSRNYVWADPRIDCEKDGGRFDAAKEQKLVLGRIKKIQKR